MELREIEFRGLRKAKNMVGVWAVGNYHKGALTGSAFISGYEVIPETVGQYTFPSPLGVMFPYRMQTSQYTRWE